MASLKKAQEAFLKTIRDEPPSKPRYPRFEVEDLIERKNYTFILEGDGVLIYDTSRGSGNSLISLIDGSFGFGATNATEYYEALFNKAMRIEDGIAFLGYVDENFQPIELLDEEQK